MSPHFGITTIWGSSAMLSGQLPADVSGAAALKILRAYSTIGTEAGNPYRCAKYGYCVRTMQLTDVCG